MTSSNLSKTHLLWVSIVALTVMLDLLRVTHSAGASHLKDSWKTRRKQKKKPLGGQSGHQKFVELHSLFYLLWFQAWPNKLNSNLQQIIVSALMGQGGTFRNRSQKLATLWWRRRQENYKRTNMNAREKLRWGQRAFWNSEAQEFIYFENRSPVLEVIYLFCKYVLRACVPHQVLAL